jgi:hypothetical protein
MASTTAENAWWIILLVAVLFVLLWATCAAFNKSKSNKVANDWSDFDAANEARARRRQAIEDAEDEESMRRHDAEHEEYMRELERQKKEHEEKMREIERAFIQERFKYDIELEANRRQSAQDDANDILNAKEIQRRDEERQKRWRAELERKDKRWKAEMEQWEADVANNEANRKLWRKDAERRLALLKETLAAGGDGQSKDVKLISFEEFMLQQNTSARKIRGDDNGDDDAVDNSKSFSI